MTIRQKIIRFKEVVAAISWGYLIVKTFVFDVDIYLIERLAPSIRWVVELKAILLMLALSILWLILGHIEFFKFIGYVVLYPAILVFGRILRLSFKYWPVLIILAPSAYAFFKRLRSTFVLYTLAMISCVIIMKSDSSIWIIPAMAILGAFLVIHLFRSLRRTYSAGLYSSLARHVRWARESLIAVFVLDKPLARRGKKGSANKLSAKEALKHAYINHSVVEMIAEKVHDVAKRRRYDLYLIVSWSYSVILTVLVYAYQFLGLFRIKPNAFKNADGAGFWSFFSFSLNTLTTSNVSAIQQSSAIGSFLCNTEVICGVAILIILVFSILTAAREAHRDEIQEFRSELTLFAKAIEERIASLYKLTVEQVEKAVLEENFEIVNSLRKARGLPALSLTTKIVNAKGDKASLDS